MATLAGRVPGARAQPVQERHKVVIVHVAAPALFVDALTERLRPPLAEENVELVVTNTGAGDAAAIHDAATAGGASAPFVEVWIDGRTSTEVGLSANVPRTGESVLAQRIPLRAGLDEVALAEIGYLIERCVTTLLEARAVRGANEVVSAPSPSRDTPLVAASSRASPEADFGRPVPEPAHLEFHISASVGSEGWATGAVFVPELGLAVLMERVRGAARAGLSLDGEWRLPFAASSTDAKINVEGGAARLLLALGRSFGDHGTGYLLLGPGVVIDHVQATPSIAGDVSAPARTDYGWSLCVRLRWGTKLTPRLHAFATLGADVVPVTGRYTAIVDGVQTVLLTEWPIRPSLQLGLDLGARERRP